MFRYSKKGEDWTESSANVLDTVADMLDTMSVESENMQASIGAALDADGGAVTALMRLQRLDFHTQKQADLASILRALAKGVRTGQYDGNAIESAASLKDLQETLSQSPPPKRNRRISVGRPEWFD